jgi:hypothetical protein
MQAGNRFALAYLMIHKNAPDDQIASASGRGYHIVRNGAKAVCDARDGMMSLAATPEWENNDAEVENFRSQLLAGNVFGRI